MYVKYGFTRRKIINCWVEYIDPIDLLDHPNNVEVGLCWYQKSAGLKWSYDLTYHYGRIGHGYCFGQFDV
jgi:hypothetical protein